MSRAFVKETDHDEDDEPGLPSLPPGSKNYITPDGFHALVTELKTLWEVERPKLVETIHWAASNGDRSENGDYIYGKKRLREVDRRVRFLRKRLEIAEMVDPAAQTSREQVYFGATVTYCHADGAERTIQIVGQDEIDPTHGKVSWVSPIARALLKAKEGDSVPLQGPTGREMIDVLAVRYP
jgi:transcription elongation factor GreB